MPTRVPAMAADMDDPAYSVLFTTFRLPAMISHIFLGVSDFNRALSFYGSIMDELGLALKFSDPEKPWAAWVSPGAPRPLFLIGSPYDGRAASPGNGNMVALLAPTREAVDCAHAAALANGGTCDGPPGLRLNYHPDYYGAYFRDPDGNKLCVCCHDKPG
jgi:catechol 2,3-dioxygenase-like lactoylglutathione lyase family enzyme